MEDDYKTKKNDFISQAFIKLFLYDSEDWYCDPLNVYFSFPYWSRKNLDKK